MQYVEEILLSISFTVKTPLNQILVNDKVLNCCCCCRVGVFIVLLGLHVLWILGWANLSNSRTCGVQQQQQHQQHCQLPTRTQAVNKEKVGFDNFLILSVAL